MEKVRKGWVLCTEKNSDYCRDEESRKDVLCQTAVSAPLSNAFMESLVVYFKVMSESDGW